MIRKMTYVCEKCNTPFDNVEDALECEKSHIALKETIDIKYASATDKYPSKLVIRAENGHEIEYRRGASFITLG